MLVWTPQSSHAYTPSRPSPLVPCYPNAVRSCPALAPTTPFTFAMEVPFKPSSSTIAENPNAHQSQRAYKPNALVQRSSGDAGRERRRSLFLKKVANDRDERRWAGRAEQIMLLDHAKQQKRWEEALERSAPTANLSDEEDEEEHDEDIENRDPMVGSSQVTTTTMTTRTKVPQVFGNHVRSSPLQPVWSHPSSEAEVEAVAQQEDEELDVLLAMMEEEDERRANEDSAGQHYGSDDDEYDNIFLEYLGAQQAAQPDPEDLMIDDQGYDTMDMS